MKPLFKCNDFICKIFVEDTDFQGVVYHANYLKYFERSRSQFLADHHLSQTDALLHMESYVVKKIDLEFCAPAKLENTLIIKTNAVLVSKARIQFLQSAVNQKMIHSFVRDWLRFVTLIASKINQKLFLIAY